MFYNPSIFLSDRPVKLFAVMAASFSSHQINLFDGSPGGGKFVVTQTSQTIF